MAKFGITFSHPHLEYLKIPIDLAIDEAIQGKFSHIRLGVYWNRLQKSQDEYDFKELRIILQKFSKAKQKIIMTVGVKAPRWPEYYWPDFVEHKNLQHPQSKELILNFVSKTIQELKDFSCISHWQVENEPFDPSGPDNLAISEDLLSQEIQIIKKLDQRPIIITLWGNDVLKRGFFNKAAVLADIVGLDLYYKQFVGQIFGQNIYKGPSQSDRALQKLIQNSPKPVWITELQAEPWEKDERGYFSDNPQSISETQLKKNVERTSQLEVKEILMWGFEYWLWKKQIYS